ncbi:hypothetical protein [Streptomyces sp. NPDC056670]|uniref:hypothetical protein n=1 Tax=Streptomyces sp. NPDC056670 TaxID=3345904 RepID=UPI00367C8A31
MAAWERTGLILEGEEGLAFQADRLLARMVGHFESGALLRDRIEVTLTKAREIFGRCVPQVLQAAEGEFLIGDTPAASIRVDGTTHVRRRARRRLHRRHAAGPQACRVPI